MLEPKYAIIRKGTVAFVHPYLLHGVIDQRNPKLSLKSTMAHYLPHGCLRRERFEQSEARDVRLAREMRKTSFALPEKAWT